MNEAKRKSIMGLESTMIGVGNPRSVAAFFDFDETLLAIDSASVGFKVLREQGYLTKAFMVKMMVALFLKKLGVMNELGVARAMLSFYRGRDIQQFVDSAQDFFQEYLKPNFAPGVIEKLRWHQEQGHQTVLVTGSIDYYLKPVMDELELEHLLCTHLELGQDGLLTGRPKGPICVGEVKVDLAQELAENEGIDLSASYGYGNSELDIPILKRLGHPVIVNPTPGLRAYAKNHGWSEL